MFSQLLSKDTTLADLYFQSGRYESWGLEESIIKSGSYSIEQGVGVRSVCGEQAGFAYSGEITLPALLESAKAVPGAIWACASVDGGRSPAPLVWAG